MTTLAAPTDRDTLAPERRPGVISDIRAVFTREMLVVIRDPFSLIFSLLQPLVFLGLFGPLLAGSLGGQFGGGSLQWFLPGVLVMISLFGTSMTGSNLLYEMQTGSYERTLVTPLRRSSLLVGRALKELAPLIVQAAIICLIAIPFGFQLFPGPALVGLLLLGVFGVGLGALSYALAIASRKKEWMFWAVQQALIFPLLILSGMMLPLESGPAWMRAAASVNPLTYLVDAERTLFAGTLFSADVLWGIVAAGATCLIGLVVGVRAIKRSTV
jgi:ABC-2 type transport system permease protein